MTQLPPHNVRRSDERGMALAVALFALVILGALVSGAFVVNRYNQSSASNSSYATDAQNATDAGLANMAAIWDPYVHSVLPIWTGGTANVWTTGTQTVAGNSMITYVDSLRRLNSQLFLIEATGRRLNQAGTTVLSQLKTAQLFRVVKPTIGVNAAVTVQDPLTLNGNSFLISGINTLPAQWGTGECDALDSGSSDDVVGIRSAVGTGMGTQDADNVYGFPTAEAPNDPTITDATFQSYLDYTYTTLAAQPNVRVLTDDNTYTGVAPFVTGGVCDKSSYGTAKNDPQNLGEPYRNPPEASAVSQCYGYFPVVHGTNTLTKFGAGARGQGTLLIDGDMELVGGFEWVGLIIIKGKMKINGNGNKITGAVLAQGVNLLVSGSVSGNVDIKYSSCAIQKAIGGATLARPLGTRAWLQSY